LALGATRAHIGALILGQGARLIALGLATGLVGALICSRVLKSFLFQVKSIDPVLYAGISGLFVIASMLACWLPARRASRVDPIVTLRAE
jgi:putative ABC transport system permease protein